MAAIDFPSSPTVGQTFTASGKEWEWDGTAWQLLSVTSSLHAATHAAAGSDPVSIAQSQVTNLTTDISAKANIASPTLTGTPAAPTAAVGNDTTQIATTAFVNAEIGNDAVTKATYTAKGDVITASASSTPVRLAVGTNGNVLTANSSATGGLEWAPAAAGATGGGTDQVFYNNDQIVTTSYSIPSGKNSISAGPVTINSGATVTIPSGSVWSVV
jgi:hypothetical protein